MSRSATVAEKERLQIVADEEEEDDECNNPILFTESDVSCS